MISQIAIYGGIAWAVLSLLFFLLFGITAPGEKRDLGYSIGTYICEQVPFIAAALLCFRNFRSPQIASGRNVWLGIGLGMLSFFTGNFLFGWWELYWGRDPEVSPGDFFYLIFYLFVGWGMILAVLPRRLNLEIKQWFIVGGIAAIGIALAIWFSFSSPGKSQEAQAVDSTPATEEVSAAASKTTAAAPKKAPPLAKNAKTAMGVTAQQPTVKTHSEESATKKQPPEWVLSVEGALKSLKEPVKMFYIVGDIFLLIIATTLLLAFWGGRFAQSWRMIAAAAFSFYIADMWFKYATDHIVDYQSGFLLEVFWVFSGVLFAIGAALEYDTSSRSRRGARKRG
jgi:hypothetical protein